MARSYVSKLQKIKPLLKPLDTGPLAETQKTFLEEYFYNTFC
jgi:hypothetical protein